MFDLYSLICIIWYDPNQTYDIMLRIDNFDTTYESDTKLQGLGLRLSGLGHMTWI